MTGPAERLSAALSGRYRVERELGAGGMATVYLAHDVKHDRPVAIKVLKPELAAVLGAERFVQEIKTTAHLQHPNILPLFDSGEADGFLYYVMPYVDGETLRAKLNRETQLGVEEAVKLATEVAEALDYAHQHQVIHRDIKPENILLHAGRPLVADFGIALAVSAAAGGRMTETGLSLGTPHYMSPEQATAEKAITARSDIYSLGAVLYECLTGEPPHTGASGQAIIMKIIADPVRPVTELRKAVPPHVAAAVAKALEKIPADRFGSAGAFGAALVDRVSRAADESGALGSPRRSLRHVASRYGGWVAAAAFAAAAAWGWLRPAPAPRVARYGLALPAGQQFRDSNNPGFALSPDGSWFVYQGPAEGGVQLWIKERGRYEAVPVPGTTAQAAGLAPAVSPDGRWIVFWAENQLRKVSRAGGSVVTLVDSVASPWRGVAWLDDGTIVYRDRADRLRRIPEVGGVPETVWTPQGERSLAVLPTALPGSRGILFLECGPSCSEVRDLWVLDFRTGKAALLLADAGPAWYIATGHIVFVRSDGAVFAAPFDLGKLTLTGPPMPVLEGVQVNAFMPDFALSPNGDLLMIAGPAGGLGGIPVQAVWVDRGGRQESVDPAWRFELGPRRGWAISPDGSRLAIALRGKEGDDIYVKELDRGPIARLTFDPAEDTRPRWTPDGESVSFISNRGTNQDLYVRRADGTQPAELVLDLDTGVWESLWSRDGRWLVLRRGTLGERDIAVMHLGKDSLPTPLGASEADESALALSPDGRWLAYQSNETGRNEVYLRPFPDMNAGKWTVSVGGGSQPLWAHSGRELFYVDEKEVLVAARLKLGSQVLVEDRTPLFSVGEYMVSSNYTDFDVTPDDRRFLMLRRVGVDGAPPQPTLILVENWFSEVKEKLGIH